MPKTFDDFLKEQTERIESAVRNLNADNAAIHEHEFRDLMISEIILLTARQQVLSQEFVGFMRDFSSLIDELRNGIGHKSDSSKDQDPPTSCHPNEA